MGGPRSGRWRWHDKQVTVEECLVLSIAQLVRQRLVVPGAWTSGSMSWKQTGEAEPFAKIGFEADVVGPAHAWMRLHYTANGNSVDYRVRLTSTRPNFGGLRGCECIGGLKGIPRGDLDVVGWAWLSPRCGG